VTSPKIFTEDANIHHTFFSQKNCKTQIIRGGDRRMYADFFFFFWGGEDEGGGGQRKLFEEKETK
jgi:hypothetical protein